MTNASWVVPAAVLGSIFAVGLLFVVWWFPRTWQKGVNSDHTDINQAQGEERLEQRRRNREIIERFARARALERGEIVDDAGADGGEQLPPPYEVRSEEGGKSG